MAFEFVLSSEAHVVMQPRLSLFALLILFGSSVAFATPPIKNAPNVILILADDLGWKDVGYNGSPISTPNIDGLAERGVVLSRFYAQPTCSPTRAALMTGQSSLRAGVHRPIDKNMQHGLPLDIKLLPEYLGDAGYQTWLVGKWHLGHAYKAQLPMVRGFDHAYGNLLGGVGYWDHVHGGGIDWHRNGEVVEEEGYSTHLLSEEAVRLIQQRDQRKPFFLYLSYTAPHLPNEAPMETIAKYKHLPTKERQVHAAMVDEMDKGIGRLIEELAAQGLNENTVVWFMSDNGGLIRGTSNRLVTGLLALVDKVFDPPYPGKALEFLRSNTMDGGSDNGPYRNGKGSVYEGGVLVPSVLAWPGKLDPKRVESRVTVMDVLPTILDFSQLSTATDGFFDGESQWSSISGSEEVDAPDYITEGFDGEAYYQNNWKMVVETGGKPQLFNLKADPTEQHNIAAAHSNKVQELLDLLKSAPRGPSVHSTSDLSLLFDMDKFGGQIDRKPWVQHVRDGEPPKL